MANPKEISSASGGDNTVIGPSIVINGKLTGDEDLTVRGRLEGELSLTRTLIVEPSGVVKANVNVKNAVISGAVVGNVDAAESVELTKEGRMVGDISSPRVILVDGASLRGRIDMGEVKGERSEKGARPVRAVRAVPVPARPAARIAGKSKLEGKPSPPPPPSESRSGAPVPPLVAAGSRKRVVVKKKAR
jgi:cytoskeletal protein CcmA (bactofilin family)